MKRNDLVFSDTTNLTSESFMERAKIELVKWYAKRDNENYLDIYDLKVKKDYEGIYKRDFFVKDSSTRVIAKGQRDFNIQIVWFSKTLQNFKCMVTCINNEDRIYAEFIYDGNKKQYYLDVYDKIENICIKIL